MATSDAVCGPATIDRKQHRMSEQWTSGAYPAVPPDEKFRHDLQRALEQTHRQQMAQRKLGAQVRKDMAPSCARRQALPCCCWRCC